MSKQSKARYKAFLAAAENMARGQGYDMTLTPARLEQWIKDQVIQQEEEWQLIWDAARTWTVKNWRAKILELQAHLTAARDSAGEVHSDLARAEENLRQVTETAANRLREIERGKQQTEIRLQTIQTQARKITDLRMELDRIKKDSVEIATRHQRELEGLRKLTTSGAKAAYENVERLAKELAATKDALILAEEDASDLRRRLESAEKVSDARQSALMNCMQKRDELMAEAAPRPAICPVTKGGHIHKCVEEHAVPFTRAPHACSCGYRWYSPEQRTRR